MCVCVYIPIHTHTHTHTHTYPFSLEPPTHPPHPIPLGHQRALSQISNDIFHRSRTVCMETKKTMNSQNNLEKEKQN